MQLAVAAADFSPVRGRPAAPGDGLQAVRRSASSSCASGCTTAWPNNGITGRERRRDLRQDKGVRLVRLRREPLDQLRAAGLRVVLAQALPPGRVLRRAAQRPADGVLLTAVAGPRRQAARRRRTRGPDINISAAAAILEASTDVDATPGPDRHNRPSAWGCRACARSAPTSRSAIVAERDRGGPFDSMADLSRRVGLSADQVEALATAGAFDCFDLPRRDALWGAAVAAANRPGQLDLAAAAGRTDAAGDDEPEQLMADLWATGVTRDLYPTALIRDRLDGPGHRPGHRTAGARQPHPGDRRRHRHPPAAPGHRPRGHLHQPRGRDRNDQRHLRSGRLDAPPAGGARVRRAADPRHARAGRRGGQHPGRADREVAAGLASTARDSDELSR